MVRRIAAIFGLMSLASIAAGAPPVPTGVFRNVKLPVRSPKSSVEESFRRMPRQFTGGKVQALAEMTAKERAGLDYDLAKESVDVVVPESARDGAAVGILVWLGVTAPDGEWFTAMGSHRLIYVTPNNCNGRSPWIKRGLAIDAVHNLKMKYNVDAARVYLSGFSAGAHQSAALVTQFPDVFRGACCFMGGPYYVTAGGTREKPVGSDATVIGPTWYGDVERLKRELRLVSVFGEGDTVVRPEQGRADHESLRLDGFRHTYIELPAHGHNHPDLSTFDRALAALDEPGPAEGPTTRPMERNQAPHPDQVAQARRLLCTGKMIYEAVSRMPAAMRVRPVGESPRYDAALARRCLVELLRDYPGTPAAAEGRALLGKFDAMEKK